MKVKLSSKSTPEDYSSEELTFEGRLNLSWISFAAVVRCNIKMNEVCSLQPCYSSRKG